MFNGQVREWRESPNPSCPPLHPSMDPFFATVDTSLAASPPNVSAESWMRCDVRVARVVRGVEGTMECDEVFSIVSVA